MADEAKAQEALRALDAVLGPLAAARAAVDLVRQAGAAERTLGTIGPRRDALLKEVRDLEAEQARLKGALPGLRAELERAVDVERQRIAADLGRAREELADTRRQRVEEQRQREAETRAFRAEQDQQRRAWDEERQRVGAELKREREAAQAAKAALDAEVAEAERRLAAAKAAREAQKRRLETLAREV